MKKKVFEKKSEFKGYRILKFAFGVATITHDPVGKQSSLL